MVGRQQSQVGFQGLVLGMHVAGNKSEMASQLESRLTEDG